MVVDGGVVCRGWLSLMIVGGGVVVSDNCSWLL